MPKECATPFIECILKAITWNVNRNNVSLFYKHFDNDTLINSLLSNTFSPPI